jgi:hypothetical protein
MSALLKPVFILHEVRSGSTLSRRKNDSRPDQPTTWKEQLDPKRNGLCEGGNGRMGKLAAEESNEALVNALAKMQTEGEPPLQ